MKKTERKCILRVEDVCNTYVDTDGFKKVSKTVLNHVNFEIREGQIFGLVGESGSGKSTLARCILGMASYSGKITNFTTRPQMVFQDSSSALNPSMTVERILEEPLILQGTMHHAERKKLIYEAIEAVGLGEDVGQKLPSQLSGGQKQRVCIAAAIITHPSFIILDEPVSALDVTIQAQILQLLADLRKKYALSYLFISHDLNVVYQLCDYVLVMKQGEVVEQGPVERLYANPQHEYTKALLAASDLLISSAKKE